MSEENVEIVREMANASRRAIASPGERYSPRT
jgi:hypothetical protein